MKKILLLSLPFLFPFLSVITGVFGKSLSHQGDTLQYRFSSLKDYLDRGLFSIKFRTYFSGTINEGELKDDFALAAGAGLGYKSPSFKGFGFGLGGFSAFNVLSSDLARPDQLTGQLNRYETGLFDVNNLQRKADLSRMEEAYLYYQKKNTTIRLGRQLLSTPFINLQDGRMSPPFEEGAWLNTALSKRFFFQGGFIWEISPRSTTQWYSIGRSIGPYPSGVNPDGSKSGYAGNLKSSGIALAALEYKGNTLAAQLWNYYVDHIFNIAFLQTEYSLLSNTNRKWIAGVQLFRQDALNDGGHADPKKTYITPGSTSMGAGFRIAHEWFRTTFNMNYTRITADGRFLMPREWGKEPFYTFIPRERNEGTGDVHAFTTGVSRVLKPGKLTANFIAGYYRMPAPDYFRLNKYGMPSYFHLHGGSRYFFSGFLKGLEVQVLAMAKLNASGKNLLPKYTYNRVEMFHFNLILNYSLFR